MPSGVILSEAGRVDAARAVEGPAVVSRDPSDPLPDSYRSVSTGAGSMSA